MTLTIILTILKIIGIVLAALTGLVIVLALLLLFVPVRYKVKGLRTGEEGDPPIEAVASVSWLLHIIHVSFFYPGEKKLIGRIFGIPVFRYPDEKKDGKRKNKAKKKKDKKNPRNVQEEHSESVLKNTNEKFDEKEPNNEESDFLNQDNFSAYDEEADANTNEMPNRDNEFEEEISGGTSIYSKLKEFLNRIKCTIKKACDKIKTLAADTKSSAENIKKDIHYYHKILTSELFERVLHKGGRKLLKLLKGILPKKIEAAVELGFDDPYTTGEALAIAGILYPLIGEHVHIQGNFEESIIRGAGKLKGRIYGITLLRFVLYYMTDRELRRLIRLLKKEEKPHGRKQ